MSESGLHHRRRTEWSGRSIPPRRIRRRLHHGNQIRLSDLETGDRCIVVDINIYNQKQLQILLSMGILPGRCIEVLQTFPSHIFQIGQTQYAVDTRIADAIYVKLEEPSGSPHTEDTQRSNPLQNNNFLGKGSRGILRRFTQLF